MKLKTLFKLQETSDDQWIATADIMATLMLVFAFIALMVVFSVSKDWDKVSIVQDSIYSALINEFRDDERRSWDADIDKDGLVTFSGQITHFKNNSDEIPEQFKEVLDDFFPRYVETLRDFKTQIQEIDVEGHTDSVFKRETKPNEEGYYYNMDLSQRRALNVLRYSLGTIQKRDGIRDVTFLNKHDKKWIKEKIRSVGYSYSKLICYHNELYCKPGAENKEASRRVQFRIRIDNSVLIEEIRKHKEKSIKTSY